MKEGQTLDRPQRKRIVRRMRVVRRGWLSPTMVRLVFTGPDLLALPDLVHTDHYVKLIFAPDGAGYTWPFDLEQVQRDRRPAEWPVTRTYTVRAYDASRNELTLDFVVHGEEGLAGPWAAHAEVGAEIGFYGPGGGFAPDPSARAHLLVGDESALPAIAVSLERLAVGDRAAVFVEVEHAGCRQPLSGPADLELTWVHRNGRPHGQALATHVREAVLPEGPLSVFVHGNAYMVRDLRRYLCRERQVARTLMSMSGYWRPGASEEVWHATKQEFCAQVVSPGGEVVQPNGPMVTVERPAPLAARSAC